MNASSIQEKLDAAILENEKLKKELERISKERDYLKQQITMAVNLRYSLMPNVYPAFEDIPEIDIYADQIGLAQVGGDFFDFFRIDSDHIGIVIADIFDGGSPAALYMVAFKLYLSGELSMGFSPEKLIGVVNDRLATSNGDDICLSAWYGVYEISSGHFIAVNAGHETPILKVGDKALPLKEDRRSFLLAVMEKVPYFSYDFYLKEGEGLLLYTDGAIKAKNTAGEAFGEERLIRALKVADGQGADDVVGLLQEQLFSFTEGEPFSDDASFLYLMRRGSV